MLFLAEPLLVQQVISKEIIQLLLARYPEGKTIRNQYGSLPLHMAAQNQANSDIIRILIDNYLDALHLQNDDGMTPFDLALADNNHNDNNTLSNDIIIALLQGKAPPPELIRRQKAEKY